MEDSFQEIEEENHSKLMRKQHIVQQVDADPDASSYVIVDWMLIESCCVHLEDWSIEPTIIRRECQNDYYECAVLPRRFVIDITQVGGRFSRLSLQANSSDKPRSLLVVEVNEQKCNCWINSESVSVKQELMHRLHHLSHTQKDEAFSIFQLVKLLISQESCAIVKATRDENVKEECSKKRPNFILSSIVAKVEVILDELRIVQEWQKHQRADKIEDFMPPALDFCGICFEDEQLMSLVACLHAFCAACWTKYARMQIVRSTITKGGTLW